MATAVTVSPTFGNAQATRKQSSWSNLLVGAAMNLFQGHDLLIMHCLRARLTGGSNFPGSTNGGPENTCMLVMQEERGT
jgi:hypothetical protein